ncbi:alpha/beta hydrolase family protein [Nocardioides sp.]|uniref:alpha/beta hydrolase family protein n=1 Tax=Nocardioides sp. TaxID=35761 RepID=UPI002B6B04A1|nr:dienelactone hydrolase family protein [Nocardioides sp.]HXH78735.1 dienelactone hydrolase family protein [Nocardioides sp.]
MIEILFAGAACLIAAAMWMPLSIRRRALITTSALAASAGFVAWSDVGLRWQHVPVAVAGVIALAVGLLRMRKTPDRTRRVRVGLRCAAIVTTVGCVALAVLGGAAAWAFRPVLLPTPTGPASVGTTVMEWIDVDREEPATAHRADHRTVVVQIWYPSTTQTRTNQGARYLAPTASAASTTASGMSASYGFPSFVLNDAARARTSAAEGAPAATRSGGSPVVLFSPGLGGVRTQNTAWAQELASHGYVVVALDHPYDSAAVVLGDGTVLRSRLAATGDEAADDLAAAEWTAIRAADLQFALTQLERLNQRPGNLLHGRLDTSRSVVTGHSLGGGAAIQAAAQDARFRAVVNIDGFPRYVPAEQLKQPLLALVAGAGTGSKAGDATYERQLENVLQLSAAPSYRLVVPRAGHLSFTDAALFFPPVPSLFGSLSRTHGFETTTATTLAFLDATVGQGAADLVTELGEYGTLTSYPRQ